MVTGRSPPRTISKRARKRRSSTSGLEDLGRRAGGENLAAGEREQPVAEQRGEVEVVGGEDDGAVRAVLEAEQQGGEVALVARVEVERRLVEHQQLGFLGQGGGDEDRLPLAARELVDRPPAQLFDPHQPERLLDRREILRARRELEGGEVRIAPEEDHLLDLERHPGGADLRHVGDAAGDLAAGERGEGAAGVGDLAARWRAAAR